MSDYPPLTDAQRDTILAAFGGMTREQYVKKIVAAAPPLTDEQADKIGRLLSPFATKPTRTPRERTIERLADGIVDERD